VKILISAGEASSDAHGAQLLRALRESAPAGEPIAAFGVGGPKLQAEGLEAIVDSRELLAMGSSEVLGRLPRILKALDELSESARAQRPDVAVFLDYPDFHFRLAARLREQKIPLIYYIPPKVWVWRKGRLRTLRESFARVLCIFPFEEKIYQDAQVPVSYVGNPLLDELPLGMTREEARAKLGIAPERRALVLMPGSRPSELKRHLSPMLEATVRAAARLRRSGWLDPTVPLRVQMPLPELSDFERIRAQIEAWLGRGGFPILDVQVTRGGSAEALIAADLGLIKSGTSTLEAALLGCPHAVVYRPSWLTGRIFKHPVRYRKPVGLVNIVAGRERPSEYVAREILMEKVTARNLEEELVSLATDEPRRSRMRADFERIRKVLGQSESPSRKAAGEILRVLEEARECQRS
jgi:lipid-A-disaccharide synthase